MSRVDFEDDKKSLEMERINNTVEKLNQLAEKIKNSDKSKQNEIPKLMTKV